MTQRIVVLDGYTLTRAKSGEAVPDGEPGWDAVQALGELTVYDRTDRGDVVSRAAEASIVLTNKTVLSAESIAALTDLKYIGVLATGVNVVDLASASARGIVVTNVPGYGTQAVAQHTIALLLALTIRVAEHDRAVHEGDWAGCPDFCFTLSPLTELTGKTLGIVGAGDIGLRVARIGHALGMDILVASRTKREIDVPVRWATLDELFEQSDVVSLHCPLTDDTYQLVDARRLALMKRSACLVNTARGPLVDEPALASALNEGRIAGSALDVLSAEPPADDNPLLTAPRCIITPHNAWAAREARHRLMNIVTGNIRAFLKGEAVNVVS